MFLTRFQFNPRRRESGKLLASPQVLHAAVLSSFPDPEAAAPENGRVLWRLDRTGSKVFLIIASPSKPDLTHLVEQAGWPSLQQGWETRDYSPLIGHIALSQRWAFRLTANPIYSLPSVDGKRGRIVGHRTEAHQLGWLKGRAERHGFSLVEHQSQRVDAATGKINFSMVSTARVINSQVLRFARKSTTVTLRTASFDGLLEVVDPQAFKDALINGIGSGKAYGCGLLTVAPYLGSSSGAGATSQAS